MRRLSPILASQLADRLDRGCCAAGVTVDQFGLVAEILLPELFAEPRPPAAPTDTPAGVPRIDVYADRAAAGHGLYYPTDALEVQWPDPPECGVMNRYRVKRSA